MFAVRVYTDRFHGRANMEDDGDSEAGWRAIKEKRLCLVSSRIRFSLISSSRPPSRGVSRNKVEKEREGCSLVYNREDIL